MDIQRLFPEFSVCKLLSLDSVDFTDNFVFLAKTDEEISLVCKTECVPENAFAVERGFSAFRICGPLDFCLVGIIARISDILAEGRISVFIISTFHTDYILVKSAHQDQAAATLQEAGYRIVE